MKHQSRRQGVARIAAPLCLLALWTPALRAEPDPPGARRADTATSATAADAPDAVSAWLNKTVTPQRATRPLRRREAASAPARERGVLPSSSRTAVDVLGMFWPLCIVLALVGLCVWLMRKWMPRTVRLGGGDVIRILARQFVSGKQCLCLARVGRRLVLLGMSPDRITTLSEITDPEEVSALVSLVERGRPGSFTNLFGKLAADEPAGGPEGDTEKGVIDEDIVVSSQRLARTRREIRELVDRVRALSSGSGTPAESAR